MPGGAKGGNREEPTYSILRAGTMKRIILLAIGMLLVSFKAFGMQAMDDAAMDAITGQSGVAISIENVQIYQAGGQELWFRGGSLTAAVGLVFGRNTFSYHFITAINDMNTFDGGFERGNYQPLIDGDLKYNGSTVLNEAPAFPKVLSMRVLSGNASGIFLGVDSAHIEIGLPTMEIVQAAGSSEEIQFWIGATPEANDSPIGQAGETGFSRMGTIFTSDYGSTKAILGGRVGITAAGSVSELLNESP